MKKTMSILVAALAALTLVGCGDPSKEDVCGSCPGAEMKTECENNYDLCAGLEECDIGAYQDLLRDQGFCT